ncbi:ComC/BlpC family leader-containing pheromone/bacteriocin [Streptococcus ruminantium]|nr:ComC/BlpC family leader-containing pheromone/bacteriocin [Streptococcus ruminantium]
MDKEKPFTQFPELTDSELNRISGGDWWADFLKKITVSINKK